MSKQQKQTIVGLLRGTMLDKDELEAFLLDITEEEFVQYGLAEQVSQNIYTILTNAKEKFRTLPSWLLKCVHLDKMYRMNRLNELLDLLTPKQLSIGLLHHNLKDKRYNKVRKQIIHNQIVVRALQNNFLVGDEYGEYVQLLGLLTTNQRKDLWDDLRPSDIQRTLRRWHNGDVKDKESYKQLVKGLHEALHTNVSGPLADSRILEDPYGKEDGRFIGWDITINELVHECMKEGVIPTIAKYKVSNNQWLEMRWTDWGRQAALGIPEWDDYLKKQPKIMEEVSNYYGQLIKDRMRKDSEGVVEDLAPVSFSFKSPVYKVVGMNYKSGSKFAKEVQVGDVIYMELAGREEYQLYVNGVAKGIYKEGQIRVALNFTGQKQSIFNVKEE